MDQGVHQRFVSFGTEVEEPFIHSPAVVAGADEDLAAALAFNHFAQSLTGKHNPIACQPYVFTDTRILPFAGAFEQEEPAFDFRLPCHSRQAGAQGEIARNAIRRAPAKLDPGVADAALIGVHQQVPGHLLSGVSVGLNARWAQLRIEKKGQSQGKHLGFACAVVAAQKQAAIAEPEFLAIVVKEFDQSEPKRLPSFTSRFRQFGARKRR